MTKRNWTRIHKNKRLQENELCNNVNNHLLNFKRISKTIAKKYVVAELKKSDHYIIHEGNKCYDTKRKKIKFYYTYKKSQNWQLSDTLLTPNFWHSNFVMHEHKYEVVLSLKYIPKFIKDLCKLVIL